MKKEDITEKDMIWWIDFNELHCGVIKRETEKCFILNPKFSSWNTRRKFKGSVFTNRQECINQMKFIAKIDLENIQNRIEKIEKLEKEDFSYDLRKHY
jgi:hypothetical protein